MAIYDMIFRDTTLLSSLLPSFATSGLILALYCVWLVIERLYLSPIAGFPGPKLAALTLWYEFYYDVYLGGQYTFKIEKLHAQYGPIVRINPYELHVIDSDFYEVLYSAGASRRDKWQWVYNQFGTSKSGFGTGPHDLHRMRRGVLNSYFSKRSIMKLEPLIREKVDALCARFRGLASTKTPVNLGYAFGALTLDVITEYCYGINYDAINKPDFDPTWLDAVSDLSKNGHFLKHLPFMIPLMQSLPDWLVLKLNPLTANLLKMQRDIRSTVVSLINQSSSSSSSSSGGGGGVSENDADNQETIFHALVHNDLPPEEKAVQRIVEEAALIVGAGQLTTADTLACIFYHLCHHPSKLEKLREELNDATTSSSSSSSSSPLNYQHLEHLPYLTSVILEGLRITTPVCTRLPRIAPDDPLQFQTWTIPPGVPVSMSAYFVHRDTRYFPDPDEFRPERWLATTTNNTTNHIDNNNNNDHHPTLSRYLVAFSKGSRSCLGQTLAWEEMYLAVSAVTTRFDLSLHDTTEKDVKMVRDMFNPHTGSGIRRVEVVVLDRGA